MINQCSQVMMNEFGHILISDSSLEEILKIEIFGKIDATLIRFSETNHFHCFITLPEHLPDQFNQPEWNDQRLLRWAEKIGPFTCKVITRIFESVQIKEQGYQSALSVLNLSKKYSDNHLNKACQIALERVHSPRYRQLNAILTNPVNKSLFNSMELEAPVTRMGYVRGSDYYGGKQHD